MLDGLRAWRLYWLAWGLLALYFASMDAWVLERSFLSCLPLNIAQMVVWGLLGLVVVGLAVRHPFEGMRLRPLKPWLIHIPASLGLAVLGTLAAFVLSVAMGEGLAAWTWRELAQGFERFFATFYHTNLLNLWVVLAAYHMVMGARRMRAREVETAQLEGRLAQAQNQALRMQLQPHFLFNTLNGISTLVHEDPDTADAMITRLADLLRMSLDLGTRQEVTLRQEFAFVEAYLAIESMRFRERLHTTLELAPGLADALVPTFLLQPLVENAVKHGLSARAKGGHLRVSAQREGDWLDLHVVDDGCGFEAATPHVGLRNTRERLNGLHGTEHLFEIQSRPEEGTWVRVRVPYHTA